MEVALDISLRRSFSSEDDTESIYSIQAKETDVVQDSDSESYGDFSSSSTLELEYEVPTSDSDDADTRAKCEVLLGTGLNGVSSSGEEDINVSAAIAAALCDSSLEAWATDVEDSDTTAYNDSVSSAASASGRGAAGGFSTCLQCNGRNDQPKVQYCDKCFQRCWQCKTMKNYNCFPLCNDCYKARKNLFPPRPRGTRKRKLERQAAEKAFMQVTRKRRFSSTSCDEPAVKLTALQSCLSGLSQDSGLGSSQDIHIPTLNFDKIIVPPAQEQQQGVKRKRNCSSSTIESDIGFNSDACDSKVPRLELMSNDTITHLPCISKTVIVNSLIIDENSTDRTTTSDVVRTTTTILNDRTNSATDSGKDSPPELKSIQLRPDLAIASSSKLAPYLKSRKSAGSEELSTMLEQDFSGGGGGGDDVVAASALLQKKGVLSKQSLSDLGSGSMGPLPELSELCILCNVSPKNGIFLHGNIAHLCCCYKCAMKTWRINRRCPVCKCKVRNVVKVFTA